jgi:hypothetical protein
MPFGLTNTAVFLQEFTNNIQHSFLDELCTVFWQDIPIHSNDMREYEEHIGLVMQTLNQAGLCIKAVKCE